MSTGEENPVQAEAKDVRPVFDPNDTSKVKHAKIGVWDLYFEVPKRSKGINILEWNKVRTIRNGLGPVIRFILEVSKMPGMMRHIIIYAIAMIVKSIIPAISLWYSSQMLKLIEEVFETRTLDGKALKINVLGSLICAIITQLSYTMIARARKPIELCTVKYVACKKLEAELDLDLPSSEDPAISSQLDIFRGSSACNGLGAIISVASLCIQVVSQASVFSVVLYNQPSMLACVLLDLLPLCTISYEGINLSDTTWAATCRDADYISMCSVNKIVLNRTHRKEILVENLQGYLLNKWKNSSDKAGGVETDFFRTYYDQEASHISILSILLSPKRELSELVLLFQALRAPATLPGSYASLTMIRSTINQVMDSFRYLRHQIDSFSRVLSDFKQLYELPNVPKMVIDGKVSFPENTQDLKQGLSIEFRNVSFGYPKNDTGRLALKNASFRIEQGQLCVIVGTNGSGKSTLLKLLLRLYDPTEGTILINEQDIKTLKLRDLRSCIASLFQDFTLFPVSIRENIALSAPSQVNDTESIERAAELGGASEIIDRLPEKLDTFLRKPVFNCFSRIPAGTMSLFGTKDLHKFSKSWGYAYDGDHDLSGGEKQRLVLARSFMKTLSEEDRIALLLFDEPSAALDPEAEYALFERLRKLRGSKTMIFSSHRFGNLTRHSDLILYMKDSEILEQGRHEELIKMDGGYASMYKIQAEAFKD